MAPRPLAGVVAVRALVAFGILSGLGLIAGWCGSAWWVLDAHLGEPCGSDHFGLVVELALDD